MTRRPVPLDPRTDFRDDGASFRVRQMRAPPAPRGLRSRLSSMTFGQRAALVIVGPFLLLIGFAAAFVPLMVLAGP